MRIRPFCKDYNANNLRTALQNGRLTLITSPKSETICVNIHTTSTRRRVKLASHSPQPKQRPKDTSHFLASVQVSQVCAEPWANRASIRCIKAAPVDSDMLEELQPVLNVPTLSFARRKISMITASFCTREASSLARVTTSLRSLRIRRACSLQPSMWRLMRVY